MDRILASKFLFLTITIALFSACKTTPKEVKAPDFKLVSADLDLLKLSDIPHGAYFDYMDYVKDGAVYIIVHPAYYFFFQNESALLHKKSNTAIYDYMIQQLSNEQKFLSHARAEKILVILVTPGDKLPVEYVKYLNDVTSEAKSFLYLESKKMNAGTLRDADELLLQEFLDVLGVKKILLGGGYIGRCQGHVYNGLSVIYSPETISIVPEISTFSPGDISAETIEWFMTPSRNFDLEAVASFIDANRMNKINRHARVTPISSGPDKLDICLSGWRTNSCTGDATAFVPPSPLVF